MSETNYTWYIYDLTKQINILCLKPFEHRQWASSLILWRIKDATTMSILLSVFTLLSLRPILKYKRYVLNQVCLLRLPICFNELFICLSCCILCFCSYPSTQSLCSLDYYDLYISQIYLLFIPSVPALRSSSLSDDLGNQKTNTQFLWSC